MPVYIGDSPRVIEGEVGRPNSDHVAEALMFAVKPRISLSTPCRTHHPYRGHGRQQVRCWEPAEVEGIAEVNIDRSERQATQAEEQDC